MAKKITANGIIYTLENGNIYTAGGLGDAYVGTYTEATNGEITSLNLTTGHWDTGKGSEFLRVLQKEWFRNVTPNVTIGDQLYVMKTDEQGTFIGGLSPGYINSAGETKVIQDDIIKGGKDAEEAAKAENLLRYKEGIAGYTSLRNRVMTGIQNLGQQQAIDTRRNFMNLASQTQQSAMKRGLSGTTIVPAMNQGIQRQQSDALNNLAQNVSTQRSNFDIQTTGLLEGFRERRTDAYPNLDMPLQLLLRQAAGGAT